MLDRALLRNEPDRVRAAAKNKGEPCLIDEWLKFDEKRRTLLGKTEVLRRRRNELSKEVSSLKKEGKEANAQIRESKETGRKIDTIEKELNTVDADMSELELRFPNIPDTDVPVGTDETFNRIVKFHSSSRLGCKTAENPYKLDDGFPFGSWNGGGLDSLSRHKGEHDGNRSDTET